MNAAFGGAFASDLAAQAAEADVGPHDRVAVSVGTNDAAPWKQVVLEQTLANVEAFVATLQAERLVYLAPPGVDEARLGEEGDRTNAVMASYAQALSGAFRDAGATVVDAATLLSPLGPRAFVADGLHLSGAAYDVILPALRAAITSTCQNG